MKIRNDFVTNSSSSSFIIARKNGLTEKQKESIIEFVENEMLGEKIASTKEELDAYFEERYYTKVTDEDFKNEYYYNKYLKALEAIEKGLTIYGGSVSFECDASQADLLIPLWDKLEDDNFIGIDTDLDY